MTRERKNRDFSKGPVWDEREDRWKVQLIYPDGRRTRRWFKWQRQAQRFWAQEITKIENGTWQSVENPKLTLGEALEKYRAYSKKHHRSYSTFVEPNLAMWEKELGKDTVLARINVAMVEDVKLKRADSVSQSTVDRSLQVLKAFFNWLINHDLAAANPVRRIKMFHPNNEVVRYLTRDQYDALLKAAEDGPEYLKPLIVLAVHTALRRGNLLRLRWSQADLDAGKIRISSLTKGKKTLEVPINKTAKGALEELRQVREREMSDDDEDALKLMRERVFRVNDVKNPFKTTLQRARQILLKEEKKEASEALRGFRFHDLRHTAASWLAMGGAHLTAIQKFLGHASIKMTLRYAHLSPDFLGEEARILDRMLPAVPFLRSLMPAKTGNEKERHTTNSTPESTDTRNDRSQPCPPPALNETQE